MRSLDMDLVFSAGGDVPAPHHLISGSGSDHLGNWELHAGRSYTQKHGIEWVKTYTSLQERFAIYGEDGRGEYAPPEVFYDGYMEKEGVVHGEWHTAYSMHSMLYRDRLRVGTPYDAATEFVLRGEEATPGELSTSGVMLSVRHPDLWEQRTELVAMVERCTLYTAPRTSCPALCTSCTALARQCAWHPMR